MCTAGSEVVLIINALSFLLSTAFVVQALMESKSFAKCGEPRGGLASVVLPVKGLDPRLEETIRSLLAQDYADKEVIVVLDSSDDPAYPVVTKFPVKVVMNEWPCAKCSGKVSAILTALKYAKGDYLVFADSDTVYPQGWLRCMLSLVKDKAVPTTFSWPSPERVTLRNLVRSGFWTLGYESVFSRKHRFLWGGSMAFRREFFDEEAVGALSEAWCDDCTLTYLVKKRGYEIEFCPVVSKNYFDEANLIKFLKRQIITVKLYSPRGFEAFLLTWAFTLALLLFVPLSPLAVAPTVAWVFKNFLRAKRADGPYLPAIVSPVSATVTFFLALLSVREKEIVWRGSRIRIVQGEES
ncbi:MAG: glycosyltransferase [Thermoprotei archaeon]